MKLALKEGSSVSGGGGGGGNCGVLNKLGPWEMALLGFVGIGRHGFVGGSVTFCRWL